MLKANKHNDISTKSMKNYTKENFLELLRKTDFPDYTIFTCLNKDHFRSAKMALQETISKKKKSFFKEKLKKMLIILRNYGKLLSP